MTAGNGAILYDASGNPLCLAQGATVPSAQTGAITAGSDYAMSPAARIPKVDALGQQCAVPIAANGQSLPVLVNSAVPATTAEQPRIIQRHQIYAKRQVYRASTNANQLVIVIFGYSNVDLAS